jgi:predicted ester cyclase
MSPNKALVVRWFEEVWNKGRAEAIDEMLAPDAPMHGFGEPMVGPAGFKPFHARFCCALSGRRVVAEDLIEEDGKVACRIAVTAQHTGDGLGVGCSMRDVSVGGMAIARIQDGMIVEGWNVLDELGLLVQVGAVRLPT